MTAAGWLANDGQGEAPGRARAGAARSCCHVTRMADPRSPKPQSGPRRPWRPASIGNRREDGIQEPVKGPSSLTWRRLASAIPPSRPFFVQCSNWKSVPGADLNGSAAKIGYSSTSSARSRTGHAVVGADHPILLNAENVLDRTSDIGRSIGRSCARPSRGSTSMSFAGRAGSKAAASQNQRGARLV
jgi:hypothetical protein